MKWNFSKKYSTRWLRNYTSKTCFNGSLQTSLHENIFRNTPLFNVKLLHKNKSILFIFYGIRNLKSKIRHTSLNLHKYIYTSQDSILRGGEIYYNITTNLNRWNRKIVASVDTNSNLDSRIQGYWPLVSTKTLPNKDNIKISLIGHS